MTAIREYRIKKGISQAQLPTLGTPAPETYNLEDNIA